MVEAKRGLCTELAFPTTILVEHDMAQTQSLPRDLKEPRRATSLCALLANISVSFNTVHGHTSAFLPFRMKNGH
jgi:hypothetical protein